MKQKLITLFVILSAFLHATVSAQVDITIGTGTATNGELEYPCPLQDYFEGSRAQYLYRASELIAAGMGPGSISAIRFTVTDLGTFSGTIEEYTVKIGGTTAATLTATTWEPISTTVFGPVDFIPVVGVNTITFATPYFWNGTDNIIIEVCNGAANNGDVGVTTFTRNPLVTWTTGLAFNGSHTYRIDNTGNLCGTATTTNTGTQTNRPNIIFRFTNATACTGVPVAGTTVSSSTNITCPGGLITLSLTGSTLASGLTYQWQSSPDNVTWTNITGATAFTYTTSQTEPTKYYRAVVNCGALSSNAASVQVTSSGTPAYRTLPYTESFETTWINGCGTRDVPNNSWKNTPFSGENSWRRFDDGTSAGWTNNLGVYTPSGSVGVNSARFHSYQAPAGSIGLLDLYVNCNTAAATKRLLFDYINTTGADTLTVLLSTDGGISFVRLDSARTAAAWRTKTILFNSTSATAIIRFRAIGDFGTTDIGIDNLILTDFGDCSGVPVPGVATTSSVNVCLGIPFLLSTTGATDASGLTYQWQSSTDNVTWTNIPGATGATYNASQSVTTYYRRIITCTNGAGNAASASVQVFSPTAVSGTFTINSAVPTGGTNFQTYNAAYDYIKCGINAPVVFNVQPGSGPYNEQLNMIAVPGASAANTVTFNGNGTTLKFSSANTNERAVIKLNNADHIRFDSLVIDATPVGTGTTYGYGVQFINNADSNVVRRCIINLGTASTLTNYAGIVMNASATGATTTGATQCDSNYIAQNTINGGYYGITLVGSSPTESIQRNVVLNNTINDFYFYGIYITGNFSTLVEGNDIKRPARTDVSSFYGIYSTGLSVGVQVSKNRLHNPFGGEPASTDVFYGIYFTGTDALAGGENKVSNNLIYDVNGQGIIYAFYNVSSDNILYYHNTISLDNVASTSAAATRGFFQTTAASGIQFINNIISISRGGTGEKHAVYLATAATSDTLNRNDYYINAAAGNNYIGFSGTTNYATLGAWQIATNQDPNSISADPLYAAPGAGDFRPLAAALDNAGAGVGITTDILGTPRSATTPDIGAYEFAVLPCSGTPIAGTAVTSAANVCLGVPFTLTVTGAGNFSGLTYQWQSSTDNVTWTNIPGATGATFNASQSVSTYYRRITTCTNGGANTPSASVQVFSPTLVSGTFTINSAIATGGTNFQTYNAAYDYIKCGINGPVIFNVQPGSGPYNEQLNMIAVPGASAANTVTFNGNGTTLKFSSANTNERAVIKLNNADHIRFDSLVIDATPVGTGTTYGYGVQFINNADSNVVIRCTINTAATGTSLNYSGIVMSASAISATTTGATLCDSNYIAQNTINGGYYAITLVGSATESVQRNVVLNNILRNYYLYGVYISGNFNTLIEGNDFQRPTRADVGAFYGVYSTGLSVGVHVSKNRLHNPFGGDPAGTDAFYGIYFTGTDAIAGFENRVTNNLIYDVNGQGLIYALYNIGSDNILYYHNTISLDNIASTATTATRGFFQTTAASGIQFINNIISISRGGTGEKHAVYLATATTSDTLNRNDYYVNATAGANFIGFSGTTDYATLAAWQAATAQDPNSVSTNPLYASPATDNFEPRSVALDNRGAGVDIATDILNRQRSLTTPDIGAYEYAVPPCIAPPTAGASVAVPNSGICLGTTINLTLNGNSSGSGQTYQWQFATTVAGPYTNLGGAMLFPDTAIAATTTLYYRAAVTCSGNTQFSTPVLVNINPAFLSGFYTINPALPVSTTNFQNFATAVAAMECGITGFVTFNVSPGTYNEQIRMHRIAGATATARVTFQSLTGVPSSVTLTSAAATPTANYVLQLDSASYITYRNLSITGTNTTNARVVELARTASFDSIVNCIITAPASTVITNVSAGIFSNTLTGTNNVIKGNTVVNGANGIYLSGTSAALPTRNNLIDSNTVNGAYYYGIYTNFNQRLRVTKNTVNTTVPVNTTAYSIYATTCDSAYQFVSNNININNTTGTVYGMYITLSDASLAERGRIANNKIQAITGNTGILYGLYENSSSYNYTVNNAINIKTTGATSYGLYSNLDFNNNYWNNTVHNTSASAGTTNVAAYFNHANFANGNVDIRNNVFSHGGGGRALGFTNSNFIYSDYNMLYTTGAVLVASTTPAGTYATLPLWRNATSWDLNSIAFKPAYISDNDVTPNIADTAVWAMHGRGEQMAENNYDINNNPRPTTLQAGVPDLGAYEFVPTSTPLRLVATPALPVAGTTQTFMLGTDTVTKITWANGSAVPPSVVLRRYSGILPPGVAATSQRMYFYVDADTMPVGTYNATVRQYYIDPWQGFISNQAFIKMGKTVITGGWVVNSQSVVNDLDNYITEAGISYLDKFTGLTDGAAAPPPPVIVASGDSSNRGTRFWVGYGHHQYFGTDNTQDMVIYLSAEQAANVTIRVNGTQWVRTYAVPANSVVTSATMPKLGPFDARLTTEGLSTKGISITSDVPIVAYAHIYGNTSSGASLLFPVGAYGYEYTALTSTQEYAANTYSWVYAIAEYDSTVVQITPSNPTLAGRPANVPFNVTLNKGQVYQVLGAIISGTNGYDMTGTKMLSVANSAGKCYPIAVFSGSSRTNISCAGGNGSASGDNLIQQNFPTQAWGRRYLVAATSSAAAANTLHTNIYKVAVKDPTTVVRRNGVIIPAASLINNFYYQFESSAADYIIADKPITIAQFMSSSNGGCANVTGNGDPEMIYLSPLEQGIKKVVLFRTTNNTIVNQYLTLIIPTAGVTSLRIDGSATFDYTYPATSLPGYTVVVKRWTPSANAQVTVISDSAFTAITYGLGSAESYGYNAGTLIKNLNAFPSINNTLNSVGNTNEFTCVRTPFRASTLIALRATEITWRFSTLSNITPNADVIQVNPVPADSTIINGTIYYRYTVPQDYTFSDSGTYIIPIIVRHPSIEGCNASVEYQLGITVKGAPKSDFSFTTTGCVGDAIQFNGTGSNSGYIVNRWNWDFSDATTATIQNPLKTFATPGIKNVRLRVITVEGCIGDTVKPVTINPLPVANLVSDSITICPGVADTLRILNPAANTVYNWYTVPSGGTPVFTGVNFPVTLTGVYYAEAVAAGCITNPRKRAVVNVYAQLATPVAVVDSAGTTFIRFRWNAVPGTVSYQVSTDNGTTFITPSSGATGLTHTVSPLVPLASATLIVRANGTVSCQNSVSAPVTGRTLPDQIYIPNAFTPNGDGRNDIWLVYGYVIRSMQMTIFNQWGQKIFESSSQQQGWNGTYKGKQQPVGVYVYVVQMTLNDGTVMNKKGSINLAR